MKFFIQLTIATFFVMTNTYASDKKNKSTIQRIGIKNGEFVNSVTDEKFTPKGFNYARLHKEWHSTFGRKTYEPERIEKMLRDLHTNGFNIVRVFVDQLAENGIVDSEKAEKLSSVYMNNVCDFLNRAAKNNVYVVFTFPMMPISKQYSDLFDKKRPDIIGINQVYLTRGAIKAKAKYMSDFVKWIKNQNPELLPIVFSYELCNEAAMVVDKPPFSLKKGFIIPASGKKYNLSSDKDLQKMVDDHTLIWVYNCVKQIKKVDPLTLVSANVFTYVAVHRTGPGKILTDESVDARFPLRAFALAKSKIDYLDIHLYPLKSSSIKEDLESIEWSETLSTCRKTGKPVIMGEFGFFRENQTDISAAVKAMKHVLAQARENGFQGFMYWTYDTDEQKRIWNGKSENGRIIKELKNTKF
jgi:hypothetical protein